MYSFCALPRIGEGLVRRGADITGYQGIHGLRRDLSCSLPCACYLGHLSIEDSLLIRVDLERRKHIDLLDQQQGRVFLPQLLRYLGQKPCRLGVLVCFAIKLYGLYLLVLLYKVVRIPLQERLYRQEVVLLGQLYSQVPLVEEHAAIYGLLRVTKLHEGIDCVFAESHRLELLANQVESRGLLGQRVNHIC